MEDDWVESSEDVGVLNIKECNRSRMLPFMANYVLHLILTTKRQALLLTGLWLVFYAAVIWVLSQRSRALVSFGQW